LRRDWKLPVISYFTDNPDVLLKHSQNSFENYTQTQRNHMYFDFVKYLVVSLPSHLKRAFLVFLEYSLRIISGI
jgi:hypothetical protein